MPIRTKTLQQANTLLKAIAISNQIFTKTNHLDPQIKSVYTFLNNYTQNYLESGIQNDQLTAYEVKSGEGEFFKYWNNSLNQDVEIFWQEVLKNNLPYQRKSIVRQVLSKGKLRNVEQWIELVNNFDDVHQAGFLHTQFTTKKIQKVKDLIEAEKLKRFEIVNSCYQKRKIPFSRYLKFGESMVLLERCNLTMKYFTADEREEIMTLWSGT